MYAHSKTKIAGMDNNPKCGQMSLRIYCVHCGLPTCGYRMYTHIHASMLNGDIRYILKTITC